MRQKTVAIGMVDKSTTQGAFFILHQAVTVTEAEVTSAISHHDHSQMMTELLSIFQVQNLSSASLQESGRQLQLWSCREHDAAMHACLQMMRSESAGCVATRRFHISERCNKHGSF